MRLAIGLPDKTGVPLKEGDLVEFFVDTSNNRIHGTGGDGRVRIVDVVVLTTDAPPQPAFVSILDLNGMNASRAIDHAKKIGQCEDLGIVREYLKHVYEHLHAMAPIAYRHSMKLYMTLLRNRKYINPDFPVQEEEKQHERTLSTND